MTEKPRDDESDVRINVFIPDNRRNRTPVEGEPETIKMPQKPKSNADRAPESGRPAQNP